MSLVRLTTGTIGQGRQHNSTVIAAVVFTIVSDCPSFAPAGQLCKISRIRIRYYARSADNLLVIDNMVSFKFQQVSTPFFKFFFYVWSYGCSIIYALNGNKEWAPGNWKLKSVSIFLTLCFLRSHSF